MADELFSGPRLKIKRANQHIQELEAIFTGLASSDRHALSTERDPENGKLLLQFQMRDSLPEEVPAIIGDAIHNIRSALDLMVCDIVRAAGRQPTSHTKFPFRSTRQELVHALNGGELKVSSPEAVDLIIDQIKPYKGGNDALVALHDLDISDKHHQIIPTVKVDMLRGASIRGPGFVIESINVNVVNGSEIRPVSSSSDFEITNYGQVSFSVVFGENEVFQGQPVLPTLQSLNDAVAAIVENVARDLSI